MILSETELELGDDGAGIMVLAEGLAPGAPLAEVLPLADAVLELRDHLQPARLPVGRAAWPARCRRSPARRCAAARRVSPPAEGEGAVEDLVSCASRSARTSARATWPAC